MSLSASLRELHRIHRQLADLKGRIARGPKQLQAADNNFKKLEADLVQAKETYKQAKIAGDEKNLQLKQRESKILELRGKQNQAESNQVYQLLKEQMAADEKANSVLSDEILEALEKLDEYQAKIGEATAAVAKGKDDLAKIRLSIAEKQTELERELVRVLGELEIAEKQMPEDFLPEYQRMAKLKGEDCLASVENDSCGGCSQTLTTQTINTLYLDKPYFCKSCGRLLYLAEERKK